MPRISRDQLIRLQKKYHTDEAVGNLLGVTRQYVHQLRNALGVPVVSDRHGKRNGEIARLYATGTSGAKLARRFRISVSQVYRVLRDRHVPLRRPRA
jgi:hypothetical protein